MLNRNNITRKPNDINTSRTMLIIMLITIGKILQFCQKFYITLMFRLNH